MPARFQLELNLIKKYFDISNTVSDISSCSDVPEIIVDGKVMSITELENIASPPDIIIQKYYSVPCRARRIIFFIKSKLYGGYYDTVSLSYEYGSYVLRMQENFILIDFAERLYNRIKVDDLWKLSHDQLDFIAEQLRYYIHHNAELIQDVVAQINTCPKS